MKPRMSGLMKKEATRSILASILSIIIGLVVGCVIILIVGMTSDTLSPSSAWDGIRLIFGGLFSTGRDAAGALTFGFNPTNIGNMLFRATPLILTGLSVAVAFKTGLFNIGAPGQYLMGTMVTLMLALGIPSEVVPAWLIWIIAFVGGCLAGAGWGAIPGRLMACLNINEVRATSSKPAVPTVTLPGMPGFRTDGRLCCPGPLPARWRRRVLPCIICLETRSFIGPPISPCPARDSMAFPWRCWR